MRISDWSSDVCSSDLRVMALTRNEFCVHERKGRYEQVSFNNHVGLALGPDIDLRLFMSHWKIGFAVQENDRKSLQFFNGEGTAMHKIYLTPDRSEEHTSELQSLMRISYAVFCLQKHTHDTQHTNLYYNTHQN